MSDPKTPPPAWDLQPTGATLELQAHAPEITCAKCAYLRRPTDTAPLWQCPQCGVAYAKSQAAAEEAKQRRAARRAALEEEDERPTPQRAAMPGKTKLAIAVGLLVLGLIGWQWQHRQNQAREKKAQQEAAERLAQIDSAKQQINDEGDMVKAYVGHAPNRLEVLNGFAAAGSTQAMVGLGRIYLQGQGAPRNQEQGMAWLQKAADAGNASAMVNLGYVYEMGQGVERQPEAAANWYQRAARQGSAAGLFSLGAMVEKGIGISADPRRAYALYELAARAYTANPNADYQFLPGDRSGLGAAARQIRMRETMSPVDVVKGVELADAWKPGLPLP